MLEQIKKAMRLDWRQLYYVTQHLSKRSGRSHVDIFKDMVQCYQKEGYTWLNYLTFGFDEITDPKQRSTYLSEYRDNTKIIHACNPKENMDIIEDKAKFNTLYKEFIGREALDLREVDYRSFRSFLDRHPIFFVKTPSDCGGDNIERILTENISNPKELHEKLLKKNQIVVEEAVVQHLKMSEISVNSVNTIRIGTTIDPEGKVAVAYMTLRFNTTDAYFDNASMGGAFTLLSDEGEITHPGYINYPREHSFTLHPATGESILGFQIPMLEEVKKLVCESAMVLPTTRYMGWDVAISPEGPLIIEGNSIPSVELYQARIHMDDGLGKADMMQELLGLKLR